MLVVNTHTRARTAHSHAKSQRCKGQRFERSTSTLVRRVGRGGVPSRQCGKWVYSVHTHLSKAIVGKFGPRRQPTCTYKTFSGDGNGTEQMHMVDGFCAMGYKAVPYYWLCTDWNGTTSTHGGGRGTARRSSEYIV
jgi:hypothetical protein